MDKRFALVCMLGLAFNCAAATAGQFPSFEHAPFVNPRVIAELSGSIADAGDVVVAINLDNAQDSNEFFLAQEPAAEGDTGTVWQTVDASTSHPTVCALRNIGPSLRNGREHDCYRYIGLSKSGLMALDVSSYEDDGTGRFESILLLEADQDRNVSGKVRHLLIARGNLAIGDRVPVDNISLQGNRLTVTIEGAPPRVYDLTPEVH